MIQISVRKEAKEAPKDLGLTPRPKGVSREKLEKELSAGSNASIIDLVNDLIALASDLRASDIHIDPQVDEVRIRLRIDGVLQDEMPFPKKIHSEIISRIKIMAGLRTDEHQSAQDGRFRVNLGSPIDIRVSIAPTYHGENAVLRLLAAEGEDYGLEHLGFSESNRKKMLSAIQRPYGMILVTGPTGSGKTTTLYTLIKALNSKDVAIVTIEDPIEYSIEGINQIGVNARTGLTFANGLRSILRQDPNVIMVGEIRDAETAGLAVNSALTGHLVLSTIHTNDAATTLPRLLDLRVEPYLISSTVNIAIGQRLVRRICERCKQPLKISALELKSLTDVVPAEALGKHTTFYKGVGCSECNNTGYKGRVGIHEVILIDNAVREAILRKATAQEIKEIATAQGMVTMIEDGFMKAREGVTTIEEILRTLHE